MKRIDYVVMVCTATVAGVFVALGWALRGVAHAADWAISKVRT